LASAKEIRRAAIQVDDGNVAFLLMAEATIATATALLSTVALRALFMLGAGTMTIVPELSLPQQRPGQQRQQRAGLGVGGDTTTGATLRHPLSMAATFGLGFHHFDLQVKAEGALLVVLSS
jgi:hypothetical protein